MRRIIQAHARATVAELRLRRQFGREAAAPRRDVVVSLTTFPDRIGSVHLTIESILRGRVRPSVIHLWLARNEVGDAFRPPRQLERLLDCGLRITVVDENWEPGNKLVHALREYPESVIVTADDDTLYPVWWLADLVRYSRSWPDAIVCHQARRMRDSEDEWFSPYASMQKQPKLGKPSLNLLALGVGGVLYPPGSLASDVGDHQTYMRLSAKTDDLWFKVMSFRQGTRVVQTDSLGTWLFPTIPGSDAGLWEDNSQTNRNDVNLTLLWQHFDLALPPVEDTA